MPARLSVVIPAHDEATVIARLLSHLVDHDPDQKLEIVVVANGCADATAAVAASVSHRIAVVEIDDASKIAALNAGDQAASVFPRAYVDADVTIDVEALLAVAGALETGPALVASPRLEVDARASSLPARAFYRVWAVSAYRQSGHIGSGVYALSRAGRERFASFPDVIADDRFVQLLFDPAERLTLSDHRFSVKAPRTLRAQIHRATRIQLGNRQLTAVLPDHSRPIESPDHGALLARVLRNPALWPAFPFYCYGYLVPRLRARRLASAGLSTAWNRDETSRI